jgi:hypothetical protein
MSMKKLGHSPLVFVVVVSVLAVLAADAHSRVGQYCTSTKACDSHEVCVADDEWAASGHCARLRILP